MKILKTHFLRLTCMLIITACAACSPTTTPAVVNQATDTTGPGAVIAPGFTRADGSRQLSFPADFGAHPDFRTEWWYYTGNLQTVDGRAFGFELTIFRVGLLPPNVELPKDSQWFNHSLYFAHFALSDIGSNRFYAFERYSRPGPGLAGAQGDPYHVWLEDWSILGQAAGHYTLQAEQGQIGIELNLADVMGVVFHGQNGYSRKGENAGNASYYYSQPRLKADGTVLVDGIRYPVSGLVWNDHEFSTSALDQSQTGWDWFSLQIENGPAVMLFQLRERGGGISAASSGTFIHQNGTSLHLQKSDFEIKVLDQWHSPHTQGDYPAAWEIKITGASPDSACLLEVRPRMADQELNFPSVTYWEGAVQVEGTCNGVKLRGNGYIEMTGYAGKLLAP